MSPKQPPPVKAVRKRIPLRRLKCTPLGWAWSRDPDELARLCGSRRQPAVSVARVAGALRGVDDPVDQFKRYGPSAVPKRARLGRAHTVVALGVRAIALSGPHGRPLSPGVGNSIVIGPAVGREARSHQQTVSPTNAARAPARRCNRSRISCVGGRKQSSVSRACGEKRSAAIFVRG
jgi:hypothetical protein